MGGELSPVELSAPSSNKDSSMKNSPRKKHIVNVKKDPARVKFAAPKFIQVASDEPKIGFSDDDSIAWAVDKNSVSGYTSAYAQTGNDEKKPFLVAIESIAALKMHNFAKNRKSLSYKNSKLAIEINGYKQANLAELEVELHDKLVPAVAAWKIKYYIERYRHNSTKRRRTDRELHLDGQLQGVHAEYLQCREAAKLKLQKEKESSKDALEVISNINIELEQTKSVIQGVVKESTEEHIKSELKLRDCKSYVKKMTEKSVSQHQNNFERLQASLVQALSKQLEEAKAAQLSFEEHEKKHLEDYASLKNELLRQLRIDPIVRASFPSSVTSTGSSVAQQLAAAIVQKEDISRSLKLAQAEVKEETRERDILLKKKMELNARLDRAKTTLSLNVNAVAEHKRMVAMTAKLAKEAKARAIREAVDGIYCTAVRGSMMKGKAPSSLARPLSKGTWQFSLPSSGDAPYPSPSSPPLTAQPLQSVTPESEILCDVAQAVPQLIAPVPNDDHRRVSAAFIGSMFANVTAKAANPSTLIDINENSEDEEDDSFVDNIKPPVSSFVSDIAAGLGNQTPPDRVRCQRASHMFVGAALSQAVQRHETKLAEVEKEKEEVVRIKEEESYFAKIRKYLW